MSERLELMISERRIRRRIAVLAHRIEAEYASKTLSQPAIAKGSRAENRCFPKMKKDAAVT